MKTGSNRRGQLARVVRAVVALSLVGTALTGCILIPQPHDVIELSRVDGVLSPKDSLSSNTTLTMNALSDYSACDNPIASAQPDAQGAFIFPEITTRKLWRLVVLAPSSPTYSMTICINDQKGVRPLFNQRIWAVPPTRLTLACDLSGASDPDDSCRVVDWSGYNYLEGQENYRECRPESPTDQRVLDGGERVSCQRD